jgi:choline kinase
MAAWTRTSGLRAILLCAGRGTRLDPLTRDRPKCLVEAAGSTILDHQLAALRAVGIEDVVVVVGYRAGAVIDHVARDPDRAPIRIAYNPDWRTTGSIASAHLVAPLLDRPFLLANGDTIVTPMLLRAALSRLSGDINLVVERGAPETDDMRVVLNGHHVERVGKGIVGASFRSLGIVVSAEADGRAYRRALARTIAGPEGRRRYHHDVIDALAREGAVHSVLVAGMDRQEVDRPEDIDAWHERQRRAAAA